MKGQKGAIARAREGEWGHARIWKSWQEKKILRLKIHYENVATKIKRAVLLKEAVWFSCWHLWGQVGCEDHREPWQLESCGPPDTCRLSVALHTARPKYLHSISHHRGRMQWTYRGGNRSSKVGSGWPNVCKSLSLGVTQQGSHSMTVIMARAFNVQCGLEQATSDAQLFAWSCLCVCVGLCVCVCLCVCVAGCVGVRVRGWVCGCAGVWVGHLKKIQYHWIDLTH